MLTAILLLTSAENWWTAYRDPQLTQLIEKAQAQNIDLRIAAQRIAESRALAGETRSALLPSLNTTSNAQRLRGGFQQGVIRIPRAEGAPQGGSFVAPFETPIYQGGFDMRWELDFYGANRARVNASRADIETEEQRREDTKLLVAAEVARAYVELRGLDQRIAITRNQLATQRDLLGLTRSRAEAGLDSQLDVERQAVLLANTEAALAPLEGERQVQVHRLRTLTNDRALTVAESNDSLTAPPLNQPLDPEILRRRPDVRAALAQINAADQRLKAAKTDRYPKVTLTGLMGRQATTPGGFTLGGGNFFSFGPALQLPIFNGGRIKSNIAAHDARSAQTRTQVEQELTAAIEEAENALARYHAQQKRITALEQATQSARQSLALAKDLQSAGLADFLAVLDAQRQLLSAEDQRAQAQTELLTQSVAAYKATAGGWASTNTP